MKRILSLSLISALTLSLAACGASGQNGTAASVETPTATEASAATEAPEAAEEPAAGELDTEDTSAQASEETAAEEPADSEETPEIPSGFDLRDNGVVTPVKTQDPWQTCWAFAGTAAAESSILSMLKEKGQETAAKDFDLSEKHLAWFATQPITENIDPAQAGEGLHLFNDAQNAVYDTGGLSLFITTLFSTGVGPIYEKYFPYQGATGLSDREYLIQHADDAREAVLEAVVTKLLAGVTLEEIVANPDSEDAKAYLNFLREKGYLNEEDPLTLELMEDVSYQMYLKEYSKISEYSKFDDWSIPELGEDGNPNRNLTSGFTLVDGNILPSLFNKDADGKWESVNWDGIQAVKEELLQGRAVSAAFKADVSAPGQSVPERPYMDYDNWAHYTYEEVPQSHAVCIVGWDDDYPAGNFQEGHQPDGNGAWLVKNSWGSETDYLDLREDAQIGKGEWGIKDESGKHTGYFWISYYDKTLNNCETMSFDTVLSDAGGDLGVWMYDYMPSVVSVDENTSVQSEDLIKTANVFKNDTGADVKLYAVSTKTANPDASVKYSIYELNANAENPEDGTLLAAGEGSFPYAGFHRVMLDDPITVKDGETIAIVAEESVLENGKTLYEYGVNAAKTEKQAKETGEPMYGVAVVNQGESFIFEDGAWTDWSKDERREAIKDQYAIDNFSIKAYVIAE